MRVWKLWKPLHVESYWLPLLQRCPRLQDLHAAVGTDLELVGRLDKDSDGLLLLTTNASLRAALLGTESITRERGPTSSSHGSTCSKIYRVRTSFPMSDEQLEQLAQQEKEWREHKEQQEQMDSEQAAGSGDGLTPETIARLAEHRLKLKMMEENHQMEMAINLQEAAQKRALKGLEAQEAIRTP